MRPSREVLQGLAPTLLSIAANSADVVAASAKLEYRPAGINRGKHDGDGSSDGVDPAQIPASR
jgi:hypothetical protein